MNSARGCDGFLVVALPEASLAGISIGLRCRGGRLKRRFNWASIPLASGGLQLMRRLVLSSPQIDLSQGGGRKN